MDNEDKDTASQSIDPAAKEVKEEEFLSICVKDFWKLLGMHMSNDPKKADELARMMTEEQEKEVKEGLHYSSFVYNLKSIQTSF